MSRLLLLLDFLCLFPFTLVVFPDVVLVVLHLLPVSATFTIVFVEVGDRLVKLLFVLSCLRAVRSEFLDIGLVLVAESRDMRLVGLIVDPILRNISLFPSDVRFVLPNGVICVLGETARGDKHPHEKDAQGDTKVHHVHVDSFSI